MRQLCNTLAAQSEESITEHSGTIAEFNTLMRELDLNADIRNGYSITKHEYALLLSAWNNLPVPARNYLIHKNGWKDFVLMLLFDLLVDTPWEDHVKKAAKYRAIGLALTVSRFRSNLSIERARKTLVDLLHNGPPMFAGSRLALSDQMKTQARKRGGRKAQKRLEEWQEVINSHQDDSDREKLEVVNGFFEYHITATPDRTSDTDGDYWQSPVETLVRGKGDCDDFVMAKYVSLRLLGIPAEQLRVGVVTHSNFGGHCVLFFYPRNERDPWVLDNLITERLGPDIGRIRRLSSRVNVGELKPMFGIGENILTEFGNDLRETVTQKDPRVAFPAFAIALLNSQRLLPPDNGFVVAHVRGVSETWTRSR